MKPILKQIRTAVLGLAVAAVLTCSLTGIRHRVAVNTHNLAPQLLLADDGVETHGKNPPKRV